jgi:hypothetical protein
MTTPGAGPPSVSEPSRGQSTLPTPRARRAKTRREVRKRSDTTGVALGDRDEVLRLLWVRARAGSVTACMLLLREFNRREPSGKGGTAIDKLARRGSS